MIDSPDNLTFLLMLKERGLGLFVMKEDRSPVVAVDFDRTISDDKGNLLPDAKASIQRLKEAGWTIIIWTARPDLEYVRSYLRQNEIPYDHINENPDGDKGDYSRKIRFDATVDDKAVPFDGDWKKAFSELERRRAMWQLDGETKSVRLMGLDGEGKERQVALFSLEGGKVVEKSGVQSRAIETLVKTGVALEGEIVYPSDGTKFLKGLTELQGSYLWAEFC